MPPFYIGYTKTEKVLNENYNGTVKSKAYKKIWNSERKENPHLFITKILSHHKTRKEAHSREVFIQKHLNVAKNPLYINRAISNEKFYRKPGEYSHSEETKAKIGKANSIIRKGKPAPNKGKPMSEARKKHLSELNIGKTLSKETRRKISESMKGKKKSEEHIRKVSLANTGKKRDKPIKRGPCSEETKKKISESLRKNPITLYECFCCGKETEYKFCSEECREKHTFICPHCGKEANSKGLGAMMRFHFDNCKSKESEKTVKALPHHNPFPNQNQHQETFEANQD
jgi:hypothetical protein